MLDFNSYMGIDCIFQLLYLQYCYEDDIRLQIYIAWDNIGIINVSV